ncbi:coiled-coil domain-containing protein 34 isoform X1 [Octodon degus]|uniref:Coiled-coil domain-containing protein 34 isoform X1 n=1 Tax=Octodon degus TaxID=10160 RepID=A0A6P6DIW8_OCTDE|nr:coiled-coil domain-containing protein 34 isoform X1 [Octodon degus]
MRAAGRRRAASPLGRSLPSAASGPSSSSSGSGLGLGSRGQGLAAGRSPSPPPSCSDSTLSLLSPLGHPGFPFHDGDSDEGDSDDGHSDDEEAPGREPQGPGPGAAEAPACDRFVKFTVMEMPSFLLCSSALEPRAEQGERVEERMAGGSLTPWELWFVGKEKEERERLQHRALEELSEQIEKRRAMQERERRKAIAEEKHKEWVQRKDKQKRKEREQKFNKEVEEKAAKELEKEHLQEKAKEKYQEWLKKKNAEGCEKKKKEKEKEKQRQAELQEKKENAERKFKEWLETAKNKPRPAAKSYGYASGRLTGFYSGNSYPEPSFYNPIPWKPIHAPAPPEARVLSGRRSKRPPGPRLPPTSALSASLSLSSSLEARRPRSSLCLGPACEAQR